MIQAAIVEMGAWSWWILGAILIGIEIFAPGTFFLWFGLAAFAVGAVSLALGVENTVWIWQVQIMAFVVLALVFAIIGRRLMARKGWDVSEQPALNERGAKLVGRIAVLTQPISEGMGRAQIGDTTWRVSGPDLPEGAKVRIVAAEASTLVVEPSETSGQ